MKAIVATSLALSLIGAGLAAAQDRAGDSLVQGVAEPNEAGARPLHENPPSSPSVDDAAAAERAPLRGNPLWAIPLDSLRATRERPVFAEARRPPAVAVVDRPRAVAPPPPPEPADPEPPALTLVGTIVGSEETIAVFVAPAGGDVLRLRIGEEGLGWTLSSIDSRTAVFKNGNHEVTLSLPKPEVGSGAGAPNNADISLPSPFPPPPAQVRPPRDTPPWLQRGRVSGLGAQRAKAPAPFGREF